MKVRNKGFTITELVIVIAVIAILAAVLIPTFSNVIEKANQTAASSSCNVALSEYIAMVTLDGDPDNNDVTGVVFSSNNYYYVYDGEKLNYIGNSEKDNAKLLAVTSYDTDISALMGFYKQPPVEEGTAVYEGKMKFTIGEQSVEVDLSDTTRTLYLYNVDIDGTTYAGFFTINNTYGGSGNVIQTVNYSYQSGISQDKITVSQVQTASLDNLVLESIEASYLPTTAICKEDSDGDVENQVTITKDQFKVTANYSDSDGNTVNRILPTNEYELTNNVINTSQVGSHIITIKHTASDIQTTCQIEVEEKHTKDYYFYNSYGWTEVSAYSWAENIVAVKPVANDFVLAGEILGEGIHWELSSSIKMFFDEKNNEWSVTGLKIPNGVPFKLAQVNERGDGRNIKTLCKRGTGGYCDGYITVGDGIDCTILSNEYNNITLTNNKSDTGFGVYNIYWRTGNILHIDLAEDQTDIKKPNYAIFSKTLTNPWDKEKGTTGDEMTPYPEKGEGWWKISLDSRSQYVVFNNGNVDATIAGGSKTRDITIYDEKPYCIDSAFYSDYTMYYFYNAYGWNEVYANATTTEPIALMSTSTSTSTDIGIRMTAVEGKPGWFAVPVASGCDTIVFSDGTDVNKTEELTIDNTNVYYNPNNATAEGGGWSSSIKTTTYYFYNAAGWKNVYAHYWVEDGPGTTWHGVEMTPVDGQDGWFSIDIDDNFEKVVFNDGIGEVEGVNKTADLTLNSSTQYFDGYEWKDEQTTHSHTYTAVHDETNHWEECTLCKHTTEKVEHVWNEGVVTTEPTCTTAGVKTFTCECGVTKTEEIPMLEHVFDQKIETEDYLATSATCTAKATYYYSCECGAKGTETFESGGMLAHQYVVKHDETQHWNECSVCGYIDETSREEHSYTDGKCECGADEPAEPVVLESIKAEFTTEGILFVNTELTASDFAVTKVMSNGEEQNVSDIENISVALKDGSTNEIEGQSIYVITYGGKTTEVTVTFTKKLTGITAVAAETTVEHGETPVLTVTASYDGAEDQEVTGFKIDFNSANDGLQTVIVTYIENNITVTTTVNVVVNPTGYRTYYFYNYAGWTDVRAHAWSEEIKGEQPAIGEKVLICKTPDGIEYSFKLTLINNEYVIQGLYLPEETSVKVGKLEDDGDYFYYTLKQINEVTSTGKDTTELKLKETGVHDFYFSENYNNDKLWINKVEGNSSELPYFKKVVEFTTWPGAEMEDMGNGWWCVSVDERAENIIFNGAIGETRYKTDNLTLNPVTPYYCINGWKDTPDISDIIVLDLTEDDNWITTSPRFAVYLFNGASSDADNNGMWLDMTAIAGNSVNYYYAVDIPGLDYSKFTVCRMNPESTENNWDNKWNQTVDLQLENGLCVKIKGWSTIQSSFAKGSATREV